MSEDIKPTMTLRDQFAISAPSVSSGYKKEWLDKHGKTFPELNSYDYAKMESDWRYIYADAMMKARDE